MTQTRWMVLSLTRTIKQPWKVTSLGGAGEVFHAVETTWSDSQPWADPSHDLNLTGTHWEREITQAARVFWNRFVWRKREMFFNGRPQRMPSCLMEGRRAQLIVSVRAQNCYIAAHLNVGEKWTMSNKLFGLEIGRKTDFVEYKRVWTKGKVSNQSGGKIINKQVNE